MQVLPKAHSILSSCWASHTPNRVTKKSLINFVLRSASPHTYIPRLWPNPSGVPALGRPWTHCCCGLRLPRSNGHILCHCRLHQVTNLSSVSENKWTEENPQYVFTFMFTTLCLNVFVLRFRDTPVVKSSSRELCYIILAGICLGYLCTFSLIAKPHIIHCYLQRLGIGLSPAMSYSALVTKVRTELRILEINMRCRVRQLWEV